MIYSSMPYTDVAWISSYICYKLCDVITYLFPNFNGATVQVWEWFFMAVDGGTCFDNIPSNL